MNHQRFIWTPDEYSPVYDLESDGNRHFVKLHAVWNMWPELPGAKQITIEDHHLAYISGPGWEKVLAHRDWLKQAS
jgi:hypothetical protein